MNCRKCHTENPEGSKFCLECGESLDHKCPHCNNELPLSAKFCNSCGQRIDKPAELTKPISVTDDERKYVTVLFCDLSGYTSMSEKLDPEEVKEIMGRIFGEISQVVAKYGGFIEKFVGDAVMALFGATKAHEDDPVRAIKAAREIHEIIKGISPTLEKKIGRPITMHTGINTGLVITGEVKLEKGTHGVLGDTINVAARLLGLAKADELIVGPLTYQQTEGYFHFEKLEPTKVKGKEKPLQIYRVVSPREKPTKTHRLSGLRADLIGRKVEMSQLQETLNNLTQGKGSIFSVVGDAGTGKSRLIEEFRATLSSHDVQWREGHCYAYAQNIPYFPLIDLFNRAWQIEEGDTSEIVRKKVESGIKYLLGNEEDVIPYIGTLYSLSYSEIEGVSPELWKSRLHTAVQSILSALARRGPTVICLEDLHWADTSSIELLRFILKDFQVPAVFLCAYRPAFSLFTSYQLTVLSKIYRETKLQDLSSSEAQNMVESLLQTEAIPSDLRKFIQDKVEGNPFYLEEAVNSLIESETLIHDNGKWKLTKQISEAVIPSTVQGIITARIDRLERKTKRILQEASVIGRVFLYEILTRITDLKDDIDKSLKGLERLDFIRARTIQPDIEYIFKHALTQEVVYSGLLKKERQILHERIGLVMEQLFNDRLPEFYESIAFHFTRGKSSQKAVDYLVKSGEKNFHRYSLEESHQYFKEAFDILSAIPSKSREEQNLIVDLLNKWSVVYIWRANFEEMINLLTTYEEIAESVDNKEDLGIFFAQFAHALAHKAQLKKSYQYLLKALKIGEDLKSQKILGYTCIYLSSTCSELGLIDDAIAFIEKAQEIAGVYKSDLMLYRMAFHAAGPYFYKGNCKQVKRIGMDFLEMNEKKASIRFLGLGNFWLGQGHFAAGDFLSAVQYFNLAIKVSTDPLISLISRFMAGFSYLSTGQIQEAENNLNELIKLSEKYDAWNFRSTSRGLLGVILISKGKLSQGVSLVEDVKRHHYESGAKYRYAIVEYLLGNIYLKMIQSGRPSSLFFIAKNIGFLIKNRPFARKKCENHFNKTIEVAKEIGAEGLLAQGYFGIGLLHKTKGDKEHAREFFNNALQIFEKYEAEGYIKKIKESFACLET